MDALYDADAALKEAVPAARHRAARTRNWGGFIKPSRNSSEHRGGTSDERMHSCTADTAWIAAVGSQPVQRNWKPDHKTPLLLGGPRRGPLGLLRLRLQQRVTAAGDGIRSRQRVAASAERV
jgi:hypothetical protein